MSGKRVILTFAMMLIVSACLFQCASADRFMGTTYIIDASVANGSGGGVGASTNYSLVSSTGATVVGNGAGGSYRMGMGFVSQLEKSLLLTVQPSGLVAHYALDESSGTMLADQSVYNATGSMYGTLSSVAGKVGTAISLNGASQAITIGNNPQTQLTTAGTLEAWIKTSTGSGTLAAVTKASNFWLGLSAGKPAIYDWTSGVTCTDTATSVSDGSWHHIAVTLNSGVSNGSTIYVDGTAKKSCTWTPQFQSGSFAIGSVYNGTTYSQYFNGSIDHVKVFNRALSANEIHAEYSAQNGGATSGLSLGTITPGASNTVLSDIVVQTDASGYTLAINQNHDLTSGSSTIPAVSGSIASPVAWNEGTTKGLGFTLVTTNASAIPGAWNSGNSYAAFPGTGTTFYTRTGQQSSVDYLTLRLRADVVSSQASTTAPYSNTITITGTIAP